MGVKWDKPPDMMMDEFEQFFNDKINDALARMYNAVIAISPVGLSYGGRYKQAHHFSKNSQSNAMSGAVAVNFDIKSDKYVILQNNLPYASVIEFGGYPNPVKYGTWRKDKQMYEVRSVGGYSYQAPHGVYAIGFQALLTALQRG